MRLSMKSTGVPAWVGKKEGYCRDIRKSRLNKNSDGKFWADLRGSIFDLVIVIIYTSGKLPSTIHQANG